ncbi:hypothetical protein J2Z69_002889 [Paenibacillus shirakamiensis]|uniref:Uncharacterized protein n=1 Tax=Paenibacillus shirakamiensis TaxID=1265935 RepID=A0ABS4JJF1_9BACL|nr:hypothetical protein [Paenibacillus shirakamiensis]
MRTATVDSPAVTLGDTAPGRTGSTKVKGPGQKASIRRLAVSWTSSTRSFSCDRSEMWTMRGLSEGLPFATKIRSTAVVFLASAPSP